MIPEQTGWVIERWVNSELRYWTGGSLGRESFLPDNAKAIRFARQQDAAYILSWLLEGQGRVAEHAWSSMGFENKHTIRRRVMLMPDVNQRCARCGKYIDRNGEWAANGSGFFCSDACLMVSERKGRGKPEGDVE